MSFVAKSREFLEMRLSEVYFSIFGVLANLGYVGGYTNPIRNSSGADPFITYFDGWYYFLATEGINIQMARSETFAGLKEPDRVVVYSDDDPSRCCNVWAPEIHYLGGLWYLYYTAGTDGDADQQRMHVLEGESDACHGKLTTNKPVGGATPWDNYTYAAQLAEDWNIDGTVLSVPDFGNYFVSSCRANVTNQSICARTLNDDFISVGDQLGIISQPTESWEQAGGAINEGPIALHFGNRTYLAYSASHCTSDGYCIATLEWNGEDPMEPDSWAKSPGCVFESANGNYGTGHNSFFTGPDGNTTYMAFHATNVSSGSCGVDRYTMVQPLTENEDGTPNFGQAEDWSYEWPDPS